jgi:putative addiction module component (TIGR02574 family)
MTTDQIKTAALKLDPVEREALAQELLLSITEDDREGIDKAWLAEVHRRDAAFRSGKSHAKPVDEVINRLSNRASR